MVMVEWLDHVSSLGEWLTIEEAKQIRPRPHISLGFLIREDDVLIIAQSWNEEKKVDSILTISKSSIISIKEVKEVLA